MSLTVSEAVSRTPDDELNLIRYETIALLSTDFAVVKHQTAQWKIKLKKKKLSLRRSSACNGWMLPERMKILVRRFKSCAVVLWYYSLQMKY